MPITFTHPTTGEKVTVSLQRKVIVLSPRFGESYSFDRAGRLLSLFVEGRSLQRTLDHRLLERQKDRPQRRVELPADERDSLLTIVFDQLSNLAAPLPQAEIPHPDRVRLSAALSTILMMGPDALARDGETYQSLYLPVSILPPDQYLTLVVQATEGCSWNRCTFCGLYRDRPFRVRDADSFRAHCEAVRDYYGAGLSLRRGLFLADANALTVPQTRLLDLIDVAQAVFGEADRPRPLFSFASAFDARRKDSADWAALHQRGLKRVYIGLETGDEDLLRFVNKPGTAQDAVQAVRAIKNSGVTVGVIAMIGLGGARYAEQHVEHTVTAIQAMRLDAKDVIYLSPYRPAPLTEYPEQAVAAGITPLTPAQEKAQGRALQEALRRSFPQTRIAPYPVDGFAL